MHYYKRHIGDYHKKAGRLSILEHGTYTLLIDACYDRERFPTLEEAIDWVWASTPEEVRAVEFVLSKFFDCDENGVYTQSRIAEEVNNYQEKCSKNQQIAIERETKRKEESTKRAQGVNEAPPNHKPLTTNQEPDKEEHPTGACDLPSKPPPIPVQRIVDLYHESLPELPRIEKLTPGRKSMIQQRWREDLKSLDDWGKFFGAVRTSDFLMGRTDNPFRPNLEWLTKPANFAKIIEGKYHGQNQRTAGQPEQRKTPTERMQSAREAARAKQDGSGGQSYPGPSSDLGHVAGHQELLPRGNS